MPRSAGRILTTHTGSLPRPAALVALMQSAERGEAVDPAALEQAVAASVNDVVAQQIAAGLDIVNDGEQSKPDYSTYIKNRLSGFGGEAWKPPVSRDARDFPEFFKLRGTAFDSHRPSCIGPIAWTDFAAVEADIARLKAAVARAGRKPEHAFMTAVSPGQAARFMGNSYYKSHADYVAALGDVLKAEYDAIAAAGFILQVDCPDLASGWNNQFAEATLDEFRDVVRLHLDVLDRATRDVPPERLRLHLCWGNYAGPHNHDIALRDIIDLVLASRAAAISFEAANPRHEHEWHVFETVELPPGKIVVPGVIDSVSNFVEHPQVVADRILRFARVVGRENVVAGTDCGFATFSASATVLPRIAWAKLQSLAEGARLASAELW